MSLLLFASSVLIITIFHFVFRISYLVFHLTLFSVFIFLFYFLFSIFYFIFYLFFLFYIFYLFYVIFYFHFVFYFVYFLNSRSGEIRVWDPKSGIQKGQPMRGHKKWVRAYCTVLYVLHVHFVLLS